MRKIIISIIIVGIFMLLGVNLAAEEDSCPSILPHRFELRSKNVIRQMEKFYEKEGKYASSEGDARFKDIGLSISLWKDNTLDGIIYDPKGDRLDIRPSRGYTIFVNDLQGVTHIISHILKWSLIYDLKSKKWYLHQIDDDHEINIATFHLKKDSPYNPEEYE